MKRRLLSAILGLLLLLSLVPGTAFAAESGGSYTASFAELAFAPQTRQESIPALGHDLIHHDGQQPACTDAGWMDYNTCSRCDYSSYQAISAAGHDYTTVVTVPTCTAKGYTTYTCSCGDSYRDNDTDATGHKAKTTTKATLTKGKTYQVSIRSYKTVDGTTYYSAYSTAKKVTIKK